MHAIINVQELDSSIEYVSEYEEDPDYDGPKSASQPFPGRHGASYGTLQMDGGGHESTSWVY